MFQTIKNEACSEITEKKSKFICHAYHVESVEEIDAILRKLRKEYHDARHNCYAYKIIKDNIKVINDSYNASYDSMKAALEVMGKKEANRKIAVLGNMLELGKYTKELHEKVGEEVVKNKIDILITVGEYAKAIADKAKSQGMKNIFKFENIDEASKFIKENMKKGDLILLKASNSMNFSKILENIK